ncbi:hypothetical protein PR048_026047 [Dryococelus australis]|uniref:Uncharacterized protein n=1 Tax=Dryococelus australis TaxID=614101 RepID=A0ABQ9GK89_9NEOP|nr:hypothetical protein PR048_026047 [Dryococelus australis]
MPMSTAHWLSAVTMEGDDSATILQDAVWTNIARSRPGRVWTNRKPLTKRWLNHVQSSRKGKCVLSAAEANKDVAPARTCIGRRISACCHKITVWGRGGLVVRLLASHQGEPGFISVWGRLQIFACESRAGRCLRLAGFLGDLPFPLGLAFRRCSALTSIHPMSALETSMLTHSGLRALYDVDGVVSCRRLTRVADLSSLRLSLSARGKYRPRPLSSQAGQLTHPALIPHSIGTLTWHTRRSHVRSVVTNQSEPECDGAEKTRRPAASSGTMPTCENPGAIQPGIEAGSTRWETNNLMTTPPRPLMRTGFSYAVIVPDDAAGRQVFSGIFHYPALAFRLCSILTSRHPQMLSRAPADIPARAPGLVEACTITKYGRSYRAIPASPKQLASVMRLCSHLVYAVHGAAVAEWLAFSPPTKSNRVRSPGRVAPGFSRVGIVPDDAAGRRVFTGLSHSLTHTHLNHPHWLSRPRYYREPLPPAAHLEASHQIARCWSELLSGLDQLRRQMDFARGYAPAVSGAERDLLNATRSNHTSEHGDVTAGAQEFRHVAHQSVSTCIVLRRLKYEGITFRCPLLRLPLTAYNRCERLQWWEERWTCRDK